MGCLIKTIIGFITFVFICVLLVFGAVWAFKEYAPGVVAGEFKAATGFNITTEDIDFSLGKGVVDVHGLQLQNPEGWPEAEFITVDQVRVDLDPASFKETASNATIDEIIVDIGDVNLVTTSDAQNNAALFFSRLGAKPPSSERPFTIKRLVLAIDNIRVADYSSGEAKVSVIPVNARLERENVTEQNLEQVMKDFAKQARLDQLVAQNPALAAALVQAAMAGPQPAGGAFDERIAKAREGVEKQAENATKAVNTLIDAIREKLGK